jgi:hypothetical protein
MRRAGYHKCEYIRICKGGPGIFQGVFRYSLGDIKEKHLEPHGE